MQLMYEIQEAYKDNELQMTRLVPDGVFGGLGHQQ